jgi:hypothetical protein
MKRVHHEIVKGWAEVLYRFKPVKHIARESDVDLADYMMVGSRLPVEEFFTAFDIYKAVAEDVTGRTGIPRPIAEYDIINFLTNTGRVPAMLLVARNKIATPGNKDLEFPGLRYDVMDGWPMALYPLSQRISPFSKLKNP